MLLKVKLLLQFSWILKFLDEWQQGRVLRREKQRYVLWYMVLLTLIVEDNLKVATRILQVCYLSETENTNLARPMKRNFDFTRIMLLVVDESSWNNDTGFLSIKLRMCVFAR